jgi:uncharacterized protein
MGPASTAFDRAAPATCGEPRPAFLCSLPAPRSLPTARNLPAPRSLLVAFALVAATAAYAEVAVPPLAARVTDLTNTLGPSERAALEQKLEAFEKRKGSQIAVLVVPTTEPEEIEQYSIRVVDAWKLGRKGVDDGALLLVAKDDRRLRIEVGRGLEGVVPDIAAKRIVADTITPRFRSGDFYGGIDAGVTQLIGLVDGEPLPEPKQDWSRQPRGDDIGGIFPILLFGAIVVGGFLRRVVGRFPGALATGGLIGFVTWFLVGVMAVGVMAGVVAFFVTLVGLASGPRWSNGRRGGFGPMGGGWGGGGFGGGGFSGGGGGFSGGGASGRW